MHVEDFREHCLAEAGLPQQLFHHVTDQAYTLAVASLPKAKRPVE